MGDTELVRFSNQFNAIALKGFKSLQLDLLMAIAAKVADKHTSSVELTYQELSELTDLHRNMTFDEFTETLASVNEKLASIHFRFDTESEIIIFNLFQTFRIDKEKQLLTVAVHPDYAFLLNDLTSNFTVLELKEFVNLHSRYAKEVYRRCKQYRSTGVWRVTLEEFYRLMGVPKKTCTTKYLIEKVLAPIEEELGPLMGLTVEKVYARPKGERRPGRKPLTGLAFHFMSEIPSPPKAKKRRGGSKPQAQPTMKDDSPARLEDVMKDAEAREEKRKRDLGRVALAIYNREHGTNLSVRDAGWDPAVKAELAELEKIIALQAVGAE